MRGAINIVPLETILKIFEQEARVDGRELLGSIPSQLLDELVGYFWLVCKHGIFEKPRIELHGLLDSVSLHLLKYKPEMAQISDRFTKRFREKSMANVHLEFSFVNFGILAIWIKLCFTLE